MATISMPRMASAARVVLVGGDGESRTSSDSMPPSECGMFGVDVPEFDFLLGIGRFSRLPGMLSKPPKAPEAGFFGGNGGSVQGDHLYLIQSSMLKKSTGYFSLVFISTKQPPSSGSNTKLVRSVKFTWAVRTRELSRTASPFLRGPRIFTQAWGTPA